MTKRTSKKWCRECGFKKHSKNHEQGMHHRNEVAKKEKDRRGAEAQYA